MTTTSPVRGTRRAIRVGVLGGSSVLLAAAAHTLGGGTLPPWWLLVVLSAFVGTIAVALTTRRLGFTPLLAVLLIEQAGLHLALGLGAGCAGPVDAGAGHLAGMSGMTGMTAGCADPTTTGTMAHTLSTSMWPMLVAHLAATLLTAWLLARGEDLLWQAADVIIASAAARPTRRRPRPVRVAIPARTPASVLGVATASGPRAPPRPLTAAG